MKVYEMQMKNSKDDEAFSQTLWIATNREIMIPEGSGITDLHEIKTNPDWPGIDIIIK